MAMEKEALTNTIESDLARRNRNWDKVDAHLAEDVSQGNPHGIDAKADKEQPSWIKATLLNGWTDNAGLYYRKNTIGQVEIRGGVNAGTVDSSITIANLPEEYLPRPGDTYLLPAYDSSIGTYGQYFIIASSGIGIRFSTFIAGRRYQFNGVYNP